MICISIPALFSVPTTGVFEDLSLKDWVISAIGLDAQHLRAQNVSSSPSLEAEIYEVRKLLAVLRNGGRRAIDL